MLTCIFENDSRNSLRHVVTHVLAVRDGNILLVRRADNLPEGGKWALPGGFLDRNETAAQGALREFREETGWIGEVVELFRINSNPDRPKEDRQNVAFEFTVTPLRQDGSPDNETSELKWFPLDALPDPGECAYDHRQSVELYVRHLRMPFRLPLFS